MKKKQENLHVLHALHGEAPRWTSQTFRMPDEPAQPVA
jgi:hypothetical protein